MTWGRAEDLAWFNSKAPVSDGSDSVLGGDGNDIIFGQEGLDRINGGLGNDWLIGGSGGWSNKDVLTGGGGSDKLYQGDNDSKELPAAVSALLPSWSGAFTPVGLGVVPFGTNTELVKGHKEVDVDLLGFIASPWGTNNLITAQAPDTINPSVPPSADLLEILVAQAKQQWPGSDAIGRMDMLTVISDKIGYILGFELSEVGNGQAALMDATLAAGLRELPSLATTETKKATDEGGLPASSTEVSYFDTDSGAFHKAGQQPAPVAKAKQDEFMVVMDQASNKPRHELYELKLADDKAPHSVMPVIDPDENESLVSRLKKMAVRSVNWKK